jgi:[acyl-carrier-protein] S-malonyltransferase
MGVELAKAYPQAKTILDKADVILGMGLSQVIAAGPEAELTRTDISQPAILLVSLMAYEVVRSPNLTFAATAGLSLGEYTALVVAEAVSFEDALKLVRIRGQAMQAAAEKVKSGMVALIGADEASAQKLCDAAAGGEVLQVANLNATGQVVISGTAAACERAVAQAKNFGLRKAIPLNVAGAFHSDLMAPAAERLRQALAQVKFRDPKVPVYANVHAKPVTNAADIPELLVAQLTKPVRWADSVVAMQKAGITEFCELGPGKTLSGMITRTVTGVTVKNVDLPGDVAAFAAAP